MALNPNIILAGSNPDLVSAMARGQQAGAQANQIQRQNALAQLYQQQGPQIMAGNQNALNALAQIDPQAAMGVQQDRQSMAATQQRMDALSAQERRAAEQYAASKSAAERQAQAERIEEAVRMGMAAQSPQQWDQMMSQVSPDLVGQFASRDMLANRFMSVAEILKRQEPEQPADEYQRYVREEAEAGRKPLTRIDFAKAKQRQSSVEVSPDGGVRIVEGGAGPAYELTTSNKTDAQKTHQAYESFTGALDAYEEITKGGAALLPGKQKDALDVARRDLQMQMKEMFNLGVLNGPDLALMDQMIVDMTDPGNIILDAAGIARLDERVNANIQQLRNQFARVVKPKLDALGLPERGPKQAQSEPSFEFENDAQRSVFEKYSQPQK